MLKISLISSLVTLSTISTSSAYALSTNLVTNDGFEVGRGFLQGFDGWTTNGGFARRFGNASANSGSFYDEVVGSSGNSGSFSQALNATIRQEYQLSFFLNFQRGDAGGLINNGLVVKIDDIVLINFINKVSNGYEKFTFNFIAPQSRLSGTLLSFENALVDNNFTTFLDDVSVTEVTPVPFEFSPALGLGVLGGLFAAKKLSSKLLKK
jgi:hypothetical protein